MKLKFITGALIALLQVTICFGQTITISGKILSSEKDTPAPMIHTNVVLLKKDSSVIKGTTSNKDGYFSLENLVKGDYILKSSAIGYSEYQIILNNLRESIELGEIVMSNKSEMLQEVIVAGSRVIQKIDRALYYPIPSQVKKSNNAYDLLRNLMIPSLYVDLREQRLEAGGGNGVQVRINNVPAGTRDLSGILAKDVLRIEYIENPGNRYGVGTGAVLNIITKKREDGGQISGRFSNAYKIFWGENFLTGKYNYKKSQWTLDYANINRGYNRNRSDRHELFSFANKNIERFQTGLPGKYKTHDHYINVIYNLSDPDKYVFNAAFRNNITVVPFSYTIYKLYATGSPDTLLSKAYIKSNSYSPSLDLYYQKTLSKNRAIELNLVGTKISSDYERNYTEIEADGNTVTDILRNVKGDKYSFIAEGNFDKEYKKIKLSSGIKHIFGETNNVYSGNTNVKSVMNQAETRAYLEFTGKIKQIGYVIGTGLTRTYFKQGEHQPVYYTFTPLLRLNYNPNKFSNLRYNFDITPRIPSLSSLTNIELKIDSIQSFRGNTALKVYNVFNNNISYSVNYKKLGVSIMASYLYHHKPVMEDFFAENNKIIHTEKNQKAFGSFNTELSLRMSDVKVFNIPDFLSFYTSLGYLNFESRGNNYTHNYSDVYYNLGISLAYKGLMLAAEQRKWKSSLFGETLRQADRGLTFIAGYHKKNLDVNIMMMDPFGINKYPGSKRLSSVAYSESRNYYDEFTRLLVARLVYNFEFGKAYKTRRKNKNNSDNETGIVK